MSQSDHINTPPGPTVPGLDDHSEELSERTEADAQVRFYRAMADTEADYEQVLEKLARAVADVIYDLCVVYLIDDDGQNLSAAAAYHPHPKAMESIHRIFTPDDGESGVGAGLVNRVVLRGQTYFRPRWRPSLLKPYEGGEQASQAVDIAIHSLMVVPMITTDGKCLGALLVGRHTTALSYDETDLALTEWIASHAAMKLETACLYRDLRRTNQRLDAAVQARDTFISIASHDLRTPLSTLKIHAQMLRRTAQNKPEELSPDKIIAKLDSIDHQVDYLDRLIDQLLNVSRIIDGGLTPDCRSCDLVHTVHQVTRRFQYDLEKSGSTLTIAGEDSLAGNWDEDRLDQVVTNLLTNAIKYGQGNPITIAAQRVGDQAILSVTDNGEGIPPDAISDVFDRFQRAVDRNQHKGLGLGLWIVREYVESHGGTVDVDSTLGKGSTFTVRLPVDGPQDS